MCRVAKQKSQKLSPLSKWQKHYQVYPAPLNFPNISAKKKKKKKKKLLWQVILLIYEYFHEARKYAHAYEYPSYIYH